MAKDDYELLDSGNFKKLERFGDVIIERPALSACWIPRLKASEWKKRRLASFTRLPNMRWEFSRDFPKEWTCSISNVQFKLRPTDFGHLGVFPEQASTWSWLQETCRESTKDKPLNILNLFAYSGGVSLACAKAGAKVTHVDASKGMVNWAKENALLNRLEKDAIRWIVDDVFKFLEREHKRGNKYDGIILDPPSYGKGKSREVFKIEEDLISLLKRVASVLSEDAKFIFLSCHTPSLSPISLLNILKQSLNVPKEQIKAGEMLLLSQSQSFDLPSGTFAKWERGA
ncbi:Uncharacterized protein AB751O23_AG_00030 [Chlamydiales bacterium SCGC AB-751-O23]|jgi:23S rRNA (cytosine1962-C5)-methyltransferase|nr:Uncharacterized protein AB751O23_AG_00030 [Chlamydiales bacterium SCGC AB-751-O23]